MQCDALRENATYTLFVPKDLADTLRNAISRSGLTQTALAEKSGVPQSRLNTFMNGGDMTLRNASKLARVLKLELKRRK